ncbi:MAG: hypothetical protein Q9207_005699 [Kuettlingeria erythrocarpa]
MVLLPRCLSHLWSSRRHGYWTLLFRSNPSSLDYLLLVLGVLAAIAAGVPFPLLGIIFGQLVDDLNSTSCNASSWSKSGVESGIQQKVLLLVYISLANFFAIYIHTCCWSLFGERLVGRLRRQYFKSLLRQELAFFDNLPAGEVPTRLTSDMETIRVGTSEKVGIFVSSLAYLVGAYVVAFLKAPRLAGTLVFMIPAFVLMVSLGGFYTARFTRRTSSHLAAAASIVSQSLSNISLIHALGADQRLEAKLIDILSEAQRAALYKGTAAAIQFGFTFLVAYSANAVAFWQGSLEIIRAAEAGVPDVTAGAVYTVIFVLLDASFVVSQVAPFLQIFGAAAAAAETLASVAERTSRIDGTVVINDDPPTPNSWDIKFQDVGFAYPSRPESQALKGVSLSFADGKFTAIVGASGSGKSTLGGLLTRLYDSDAGSISLGGQNISTLNVRELRRHIATVDQDPAILCCSILENIAFGTTSTMDLDPEQRPVSSRLFQMTRMVRQGEELCSALRKEPVTVQRLFEQVQQAAVLADAHSFVQDLQHGYATLVGVAGVELSGGQQQRLALARALVRDPPILLLDEATSSLDSISEQKILNALKENRNGKTTITIAHRLGTVKAADRIIVMHEGRVVEEGTHNELLERGGRYKVMSEAQSVSTLVSAEPSDVSTTASSISTDIKALQATTRRGSFKSFRRPSFRRSPASHNKQVEPQLRWAAVRNFTLLARPHLPSLVVGVIGAVIAGGAYSADAVIFGTTVGRLDSCNGVSKVKSVGKLAGLLFFILALSAFLANSVGGSAFGRVAEKVVFKIRILTFRSLMHRNLQWHTSGGRTPALLLSYFTADTNALAGLSGVITGTILTILVNLIASILLTHIIAWKIAVVLLATLPILLGSGFMRLYAVSSLQVQHQKLYAIPAGISLEAVASIKIIASYSLEGIFDERYRQSLQAPYKASLRALAYTNFWLATAYSVSFLIYALAYWWGARQIIAGTYSQTQFFIVLPALLFSAQSCGQMFALAPDVSNARLAAMRLFNLIKDEMSAHPVARIEGGVEKKAPEEDLEKALMSASIAKPGHESRPMAIEMRGVSFVYPDRPDTLVLKDLDISIQPGQFCALVGPSGAGKSTIISLLESFFAPSSGTIHLDDQSITSTTTTTISHRSSISLVPQTSTLFSDTIRFNIALGAHPFHSPSDAEIVQACVQANIHSTITALPHGYATQCGANASHFSGGQKQRLCIARALVRRPRLLLLDEPTSALDTESEASLQATIESLRGRMTVLVVAHRLCTIRRADRIFWVEDGRCMYSGTHAEMLVGCPGYRESAAHQAVG